MLRKKKFLIGGIIIILAIGSLAYSGFKSSVTYYYTVSELAEQGSAVCGNNIRVNGQVAASPEREPGSLIMKFTLTEGEKSLPVLYHGTIPDAFQAGSDVVVEGYLNSAGVFQASNILTKCPSKYEPAQ